MIKLQWLIILLLSYIHLNAQEINTTLPADSLLARAQEKINVADLETALNYLQPAADKFEANEDWDGYAHAYATMTSIYQQFGKSAKSVEATEKVLKKIKANIGENNVPYAKTLMKSAYPLLVMSQVEKALANAERSCAIFEAQLGKEDMWTALAYGELANILRNLGRIQEAKDAFLESIEIINKVMGPNSNNVIHLYGNVAMIYRDLGELEKAIEHNNRAIQIVIKNYGEKFPGLSYGYRQLALCYLEIKNFDQAIYYQDKSIELHYETVKIENAVLGEMYNDIASTYAKAGNYKTAKSYFKKGIQIIINDIGSTYNPLTFAYNKLGGIYELEEKPDSAKYFYQKTIEVLTFNKRINTINAAIAQNGIALAEIELGNYQSALMATQKGIIFQSVNFSDTTNFSNPRPENFIGRKDTYDLFSNKAMSLRLMAENAPERITLLKKARQTVLDAIAIYDAFRNDDNISLEDKIFQAKFFKSLSLTGIDILNDLYKIEQKPDYLATQFELLQKSKSWQLLSAYNEAEVRKGIHISEKLLAKEARLNEQRFAIEQKIEETFKENKIKEAETLIGDSLFLIKQKYHQFTEELAVTHPQYYEMKYQYEFPDYSAIQALIDENTVVVEYALASESKNAHLFAFIMVGDQNLNFQKIPLQSDTPKTIQSFNKLLRKSTMNRNTSREKFIGLSHELYQQFIQPIEDQLVGKERLIIIGDGMTNYIPFEVLLKSNESKPFTELDYLMKNHEISYHYSATLFAKTRAKERADFEGIYAFAPVYENEESTTLASRKREQMTMDTTLRAFDADGNYQPLPESEKEVKNILQQFQAQGISNSTLALRADATERSLKTNLEKPYQFIHIAGHSFADVENPKFSGIACFGAPEQGVEDGTLYTGEIYNLATKADAVVLSSCESGLGKLEKSEGLLGLNRAFIYAGTPNVVFSLWKIYDTVSADLMRNFYEEILKGQSYSAALREAKQKLLEDEGTASPHFWSPFLLIGR